MAIALDTSTNSGGNTTYAHTCAATANLIVLATAAGDITGLPSSITYAGVSMTNLVSQTGGNYGAAIWYLLNPTAGANNIVISGPANQWCTSYSFIGANVGTTFADSDKTNVVSNSVATVTLDSFENGYTLYATGGKWYMDGGSISMSAGLTASYETNSPPYTQEIGYGADVTTVTATQSAWCFNIVLVACKIRPAPVASSPIWW